jgi:hypothetical protein
MNEIKRPISIPILACVYILVGVAGFVFHFHELLAAHREALLIEATELLAIVAGAFLLRGQNWARWLALAWIAFHVVISAFHPVQELLMHSLFCVVIAWLLFRPAATRYFRRQNWPV